VLLWLSYDRPDIEMEEKYFSPDESTKEN